MKNWKLILWAWVGAVLMVPILYLIQRFLAEMAHGPALGLSVGIATMTGVKLLQHIDAKSSEIQSLVGSLNKRRKSIKNRVYSLAFERVIERDEDGDLEKLEVVLKIRRATSGPSFQLHVWSDRWVWVDARLGGKSGWEWEWQCEGRYHGNSIGRDLVESIEKSIPVIAMPDANNIVGSLDKVWEPLLAQGPKEVASR